MDDELLLQKIMDIMVDEDSPERILKKVSALYDNDIFRAKAAIMKARAKYLKDLERK